MTRELSFEIYINMMLVFYRVLRDAGGYRDWPSGRGIFHNNDKTFLVWVCEEDHMRIISMQRGGDVSAVFTRLVQVNE